MCKVTHNLSNRQAICRFLFIYEISLIPQYPFPMTVCLFIFISDDWFSPSSYLLSGKISSSFLSSSFILAILRDRMVPSGAKRILWGIPVTP